MPLENPHPLWELSENAEVTYGMLRAVSRWDWVPRPLDLFAGLPDDFDYDAALPNVLVDIIEQNWLITDKIKSDIFDFVVDRCSDKAITSNVVSLAFAYCQPEMIRRLLDKVKVELRPAMLKSAVLRTNHSTMEYFFDINPNPVLENELLLRVLEKIHSSFWDENNEKNILITRSPRIVFNERIFAAILDKRDGNKYLDFLNKTKFEVSLTSLTAEIAARRLNLESIKILRDKCNFQWNGKTINAAASNEQHGDALWDSMIADISEDLITDDVIGNAATALLADSLEDILKRRPDYRWTERVILATLRTRPPEPEHWWENSKENTTLRKLNLLLSHERSSETDPGIDFWAAVIVIGHSQTLEILQVLMKHMKLTDVTDTLVVASFSNPAASDIVQLLFAEDPRYRLSEEALFAFFQFHRWTHRVSYHPNDDEKYEPDNYEGYLDQEPLTRAILEHSGHLSLSGEMIAAAFHDDHLLRAVLNSLPRPGPVQISEASFLRGISCFDDHPGVYIPSDTRSHSVEICLQNSVTIEMTTLVLEKIVTCCPLETMEHLLASEEGIEITNSMRLAAAQKKAPMMLRFLAEKSDKVITYDELDAIFDEGLPQVKSICDVLVIDGWQLKAHSSVLALLCYDGHFEEAEQLFSTVSDTERDVFLGNAVVKASTKLSDDTAIEMIQHFGLTSLSDIFFRSLPVRRSRRVNSEAVLSKTRFWDRIVSIGCHVPWNPSNVDDFLRTQIKDVCMRVMMGGSGFPVNEDTLLAAVKHGHEYILIASMFQHNSRMAVSRAHIKEAVKTKGTEVLDFLVTRTPNFEVDSHLLKLTLTNPWYREIGLRKAGEDYSIDESCSEYLIDAAPPSSITEEVLIQAAHNLSAEWFSLLAMKALPDNFTLDVMMAAMMHHSSDKRLLIFLDKFPHFAEHLDTKSLLAILQLPRGRDILEELEIDIDKMDIQITQAYLKEALERYEYNPSRLVSELMWLLPRAKGVKITDEMLSYAWPDGSAVQLLTNHDPEIIMGRHCFKELWRISANDSMRFTKRLPDCPFAISSEVITVVLDELSGYRYGGEGEACLNVVLGPEYRSYVCESAFHELARRGQRIWFFRLLERVDIHAMQVRDWDGLVSAAETGGVDDIVATCKRLQDTGVRK